MSKNIGKYLHDIQFETNVYDGVFWVPINVLGKTRYHKNQIKEMLKLSIAERRNKIDNLYEAIQLFQISDFQGVFDNSDYWIDDIHWQTHKTPEQAVASNSGCCATDTNWLSFFINGKYDSVGSLCYANCDGNGHITTYIKQNGYYYFIDMMMCRRDSQEHLCIESGNINDLVNSEWAGFLFKCKNPKDYCLYMIDRMKAKNRDIPYCFYMRNTVFVTATGAKINDSDITFYAPSSDNPEVIYKDNDDNHRFEILDLPIHPHT